ncbi:hypothetical protein VFPPC_03562 [Pochonia chlamydosporia 170]|uniref:Uncharacterized protein n=1 Tax=Pochonia chlamydosporia 170 TaxID=1380566 RepID=A0A179G190_METCM|nr:hypothetical protein VFPPC_03562 [Pochonia chlamydosporia 170]OAQ71230.1 hypothetical protein VFPPC_03562 [Pochonia chlamydosporia 170]
MAKMPRHEAELEISTWEKCRLPSWQFDADLAKPYGITDPRHDTAELSVFAYD